MPLPPWLDIRPEQFVRAMQAGTVAGQAAARAAQAQWEEEQRLKLEERRIEAARQQNKAQLDALTQYRLGELGLGKERVGVQQSGELERGRHNLEMEALAKARTEALANRREAGLVELPGLPGFKFIRQPSGTLTPTERPTKDLTPAERLNAEIRLRNMMKLGQTELGTDPDYQSRTNWAGGMLNQLKAPSKTKRRVYDQTKQQFIDSAPDESVDEDEED